MKINSYAIGMDSERTYSSLSTRRFNMKMLRAGEEEPQQDFFNTYTTMSEGGQDGNESVNDESKSMSSNGKSVNNEGDLLNGENNTLTGILWDRFSGVGTIATERIGQADPVPVVRDLHSVRQQFVLYLWRLLFGDREAEKMSKEYGITNQNSYIQGPANQSYGANQSNYFGNFGNTFAVIRLSGIEENYYFEQETLDFSSSGCVTTEDGRTIEFDVNLHMSRSFEQYYRREGLEIPQMCDPLVLNFDGDASALSDVKFEFDLDCDGEKEMISRLCDGQGCLALDKNNDGIVNDGSELFGTKSGDGFADLEKYDEDGNGWIDENDSVFDKLKIWVMDEEGNETLLSLREKGVGAISLGNSKNDFSLRSVETGNLNGIIRSMGMFLYEDGNVGMMSQLDIAN